MKRRELNGLARSLTEMMLSRNNDINGYWGIGILCALAKSKNIYKMSFKMRPTERIKVYGCEITDSELHTAKLAKLNIDSIEGRISFFPDGRYANGKEKYTCGMAIAVTYSNRTGLFMSYVECWPHDQEIEKRRVKYHVSENINVDGVMSKVIKWITKSRK